MTAQNNLPLLRRGDIFCSANPMFLGRAINIVQTIWSPDHKSTYSHSGIIVGKHLNRRMIEYLKQMPKDAMSDRVLFLNKKGFPPQEATSFEALSTIRPQKFYNAYKGSEIIIGRHKDMNEGRFKWGWDEVRKQQGKIYPFLRLPLFLLPPLAALCNFGRDVCSELAPHFIYGAGLINYYKGLTPDFVADMIVEHRGWEIIFEGKL